MSNGQIALALSSAVFAIAAAIHYRARRPPGPPPSASASIFAPAPTSAPTPSAAPARHPVLAAADWLKADREKRAAEAYIAELAAAGVPTELDGLRSVFAPKAPEAPAPTSAPAA